MTDTPQPAPVPVVADPPRLGPEWYDRIGLLQENIELTYWMFEAIADGKQVDNSGNPMDVKAYAAQAVAGIKPLLDQMKEWSNAS